uniref:Uncharacterized protein n=1 Tax=Arundo donax TaxID=35708 RepID=A0A0A9FU12_ARUDO
MSCPCRCIGLASPDMSAVLWNTTSTAAPCRNRRTTVASSFAAMGPSGINATSVKLNALGGMSGSSCSVSSSSMLLPAAVW